MTEPNVHFTREEFAERQRKARAVLRGRYHVSAEDIQAVAHPILRHRIIPNFAARSEGMDADDIIDKLMQAIPVSEAVKHAVHQ